MQDRSMIDDEKTFQHFKYRSADLGPNSSLPVVSICAVCGNPRVTQKRGAHCLCGSCACRGRPSPMKGKQHTAESRRNMTEHHADFSGKNNPHYGKPHTEESKQKISAARKGIPPHNLGVPMSEEQKAKLSEANGGKKLSLATRRKMSETRKGMTRSEGTRRKIGAARRGHKHSTESKRLVSEANKGTIPSMEARRRMSAAAQGIHYDDWESFAKDQPYCPKFNESCRESNREKYDRRCFLSDVTEEDNGQKLSVHHYDMNKAQGCDGHTWKLVPLCKKLHSTSHTPTWTARIQYLLNHVWSGA